jgi:hypothetical protein
MARTIAASPLIHDFSGNGCTPSCEPLCLLYLSVDGLAKRARRRRIAPDDLVSLVVTAQARCMICRRCHATSVEHCHETGRVRGIVCRWCNNRIAILEGAFRHRPPVYPRRLGCWCLPPKPSAAEQRWLENATYRFLDHAMTFNSRDPRSAFAGLARDPYHS